jgi:hypothetical protein
MRPSADFLDLAVLERVLVEIEMDEELVTQLAQLHRQLLSQAPLLSLISLSSTGSSCTIESSVRPHKLISSLSSTGTSCIPSALELLARMRPALELLARMARY